MTTPHSRSTGGEALAGSLDVACQKPHLNALFDVVCWRNAGRMRRIGAGGGALRLSGRTRAMAGAPRAARAWRSCPCPSSAGAWGELWFVRELLRRGAPWVGLWRGREGAVHDIAGPGGAPSRGQVHDEPRAPVWSRSTASGSSTGRRPGGSCSACCGFGTGRTTASRWGPNTARSCVAVGADHGELARLLGRLGLNRDRRSSGQLVSRWCRRGSTRWMTTSRAWCPHPSGPHWPQRWSPSRTSSTSPGAPAAP